MVEIPQIRLSINSCGQGYCTTCLIQPSLSDPPSFILTYTVGKNAKKVFKKTIPKIIGTLGQEPPFIIVTASLSAEELITDQELMHIKAKPTPAEKGDEITQKLLNKIEASDDPVQCLLTICDVFESEEVDNETLRKHGASMRSNFTSKNR